MKNIGKGDSLSEIIVISVDIGCSRCVSAGNQCNLGLLSLALLATLLGELFLLHLLVAQGSQRAGNLLDLVAGKVLGKLLGEFLQEDNVLGFLRVATNNWNKSIAHLLELDLGLWVEERKSSEINSGGRVLAVKYNGVGSRGDLAAVADANVSKQILSVLQVGFLFGASQALSSCCCILLFTALIAILLGQLACLLGLSFCDSLSLRLVVGGGFSICFGLLLCGDLCLLALYLGILSCIPRVDNIGVIFFIVELASGCSGNGRRGGRGGRLVRRFICKKKNRQ